MDKPTCGMSEANEGKYNLIYFLGPEERSLLMCISFQLYPSCVVSLGKCFNMIFLSIFRRFILNK